MSDDPSPEPLPADGCASVAYGLLIAGAVVLIAIYVLFKLFGGSFYPAGGSL